MSNSHPGPDDPTAQLILSLVGPSFEIPSGVDWTRALDLLHLHALGPLAAATDRAFGGGLLPSGVRSSLDPTYRRTAIHTALTLETAGRARTALTEAGIPSLVFKGAGLVDQGVYPDPGSRPMDDVDLLVRPEDAASAVEALGRSGFLPWTPWEPGRSHWLDSMSFLDETAPPGVALAVDLHWRTEYGHMRFGDPEGGSVLWDGADVEAGTPSYEAHLQVVAEHVLKHLRYRVHFPGLADLSRVAEQVADWDEFSRLAASRRTAPAVGLVLDLARSGAGAKIPDDVVQRLGGRGTWVGSTRRWLRLDRLVGRVRPVESRSGGCCSVGCSRAPRLLRDVT